MDNDEFVRVRALFGTLADLPGTQRLEKLESDAHISERTRGHLRALLNADALLSGTTVRAPVGSLHAHEPASWIGARLGAFLVERELGHGGMGSVFLAHRADGSIEQKVAIKLIRPEQLDEHTLARFRLERRVLALLKHPHIATLIEIGDTDGGMPYVVMEYVEGLPITRFCDEKRLDVRARLRLFLGVCEAVSHAHRSLIVHRDLKPSNILVTADGKPKLLDFGIAKPLLSQLGTQQLQETATAQRFFSPYCAAPEQLRGEAITVACDVYGLGALLYEMLARSAPFDFTGKAPREIERMILDVEPPPPSVRGSSPMLRGDLDAIVRRTLRKNPTQRYASVNQLADDVRRFLHRRPVAARRGNWFYRCGRFVARHRLALAASLAIVVLASAMWLLVVSPHRLAERERTEKIAALSASRAPYPGDQDLPARDIGDDGSSQPPTQFDLNQRQRAQLLIAKTYLRLDLPNAARETLARIGEQDSTWDAALTNEIAISAARADLETGDLDDAAKLVRAGLSMTGTNRYPWMLLNARMLWIQGKQEESRNAFMQLWAAVPDGPPVDAATPKELDFLARMMSNRRGPAEQPALSEQRLPHAVPAAVDDSTSAVAAPNKEPALPQDPTAHTGPDSEDDKAVRPDSRQAEAALAEIARAAHRRRMEAESNDALDRDARDTLRSVPDADVPDARSPPGR